MATGKIRIPGLWLIDSTGAIKLNYKDIAYCYHSDDVTEIVYSDGDSTRAQIPLKKFENRLSGKGFYRCHRNYLVNLGQIITIPENGYTFTIAKKHKVRVARRRKSELLKMFTGYRCHIT